jgi:hypothetical protein
MDFQRSQSVDVVTREVIENVKTANVVDVLRFTPGNHHLNSRTTVYDYSKGDVDKNTMNVFYDNQNNPAYLESVFINNNGITIKGVEEVLVNKDLKQGYRWNNLEGKSAQRYDDAADKYLDIEFTPNWKPMFHYDPIDPSAIQPMNKTLWHQKVQDIFSLGEINRPVSDNVFGGKAEVVYSKSRVKDMRIGETRLYDKRGTLREYIYNEYYSDDWVYEEITYYDCDGQILYFESTLYDDWDYEIEMVDVAYKNGKPVAGLRDVDDVDASFRQYYNPDTGEFEYVNMWNWDYAAYQWVIGMANADEPCDDFEYNDFFAGPSLISEDSYERFNTIGVDLTYTRYLNPKIGLVGDIGITFGSQNNIDYTKLNLFAGITWLPCSKMGRDDKLCFSLQALVGVISITDKYNQSKNTSSDLGGYLGAGLDYDLNKKWGVQGKAGWNPVFGDGNTANNYRAALGLRYSF